MLLRLGDFTDSRGDARVPWSVSVSGNRRITFMEADGYVDRLNLKDYH